MAEVATAEEAAAVAPDVEDELTAAGVSAAEDLPIEQASAMASERHPS